MNKLVITALILGGFSVAHAQKPAAAPASGVAQKPAAAPATATATKPAEPPAGVPHDMTPPKPGAETDALKPFAHSSTSTGTVPAMAMGNPAEMPTKAKETCKWSAGGFWISCDIDETVGTGKTAMKWQGHWTFGYDLAAKAYRGVMFTSSGDHMAMKGTLDGAKLTWESAEAMKVPNMPSKLRITEDATDPKAIKFTEEGLLNGKWVPLSTAVEKPTK
jgi:hypothetical protein